MSNHANIYEFSGFRLDTAESRLLLDGQPIPLEPQVFKTLRVLVENGGHLCDKRWLLEQVWGETFVEEGNLARNISVLRKALGGRENGNRFIETVPKRGYRFVAAVRVNGEDPEVLRSPAAVQTGGDGGSFQFRGRGWTLAAVLVSCALVILAASLLLRRASSGVKEGTTSPEVEFTQLTNARGEEAFPSLSPDGKLLVYSSSDGASADNWSGNANIYLLRIGASKPINLTGDSPGGGAAAAFWTRPAKT